MQQTDLRFLITSRSVLLRMRNVSDEICKENQNTHFVFSNLSRKVAGSIPDGVIGIFH